MTDSDQMGIVDLLNHEAHCIDITVTDGDECSEAYAKMYIRAANEITRLTKELEAQDGHGKTCVDCGEPCNRFAGAPSRWPVALPSSDNPGVPQWHHAGCIATRLQASRQETAKARDDALEEAAKLCTDNQVGVNTKGEWTVSLDDGRGTHPGLGYAKAIRALRGTI